LIPNKSVENVEMFKRLETKVTKIAFMKKLTAD